MRTSCLCVAVCILLVASCVSIHADPWVKSVDANLTLTQNAYSDSWVGGEAGSLSWVFNSNSLFERRFNAKINGKNTLKLFFGQTHNQDRETKDWERPVKSTDRIDFETVLRLTLGGFVDPFASGRIETQFLDQSDAANERVVNPVIFTESFGVAKVLTKSGKREWSARFGGGFREFLDRDALDAASGKKSTKTNNDGGLLFVSDFTSPLADSAIAVTSKLSVYRAFYYSKSDAYKGLYNENYWKAPDVNWENIFTASITKYLMVNLYVQLLYDKEVSLAGRFKQSLSLGVTYKLM